ncbi:MAG: hypothetical protein M3Y59_07285 [Myxococcota bacterium]|nr:hypothetical protein [Myxococcota bacterium]
MVRCWAVILVLTLCCLGRVGLAAESGYEERLIGWGLELHGRMIDPAPEGKVIEEIVIASEDIVAATDPYPQLLNALHVKTRPIVVERELTLEVGQPYAAMAAQESERNLRRLFILAVARVVPVQGSAPDRVGVLVVTKDLWSIRLNSEFSLVQGSLLQYLRLRPTEQNFLGFNQQLSLDFELRLDTIGLGQIFTMRRAFGSTWLLSESARVLFSRETMKPEGTIGQVVAQEPLTSLSDPSAAQVRVFWDLRRRRLFRGGEIWQLPFPNAQAPSAFVPFVYDLRNVGADASYTRSLGSWVKLDLTGAVAGYSRRYTPPAESNLSAEQQDWFGCNGLPRSEDGTLLIASARVYTSHFRVLRDIETFGLSEDYQLGPNASLTARWSEPALLSPQRYLEVGATARYRLYSHDNLLTLSAGAGTRIVDRAPGCGLQGPFVNNRLAVELYNVSPPVWIGRFALRAVVEFRDNDLSRTPLTLGGSNGLRGADAEQYLGQNLAMVNFEYRTRPVEILTLHAGLVLFVDAAAAFPETAWVRSVGLGLRLLFPQFDKESLRIDIGYVLDEPAGARPFTRWISASFGQITDVRPSTLDNPI